MRLESPTSFGEALVGSFTAYYKDVIGLVGTQYFFPYVEGRYVGYTLYVNEAYANIKGFEVRVDLRRTKYLSRFNDIHLFGGEGERFVGNRRLSGYDAVNIVVSAWIRQTAHVQSERKSLFASTNRVSCSESIHWRIPSGTSWSGRAADTLTPRLQTVARSVTSKRIQPGCP